jgi:hypothetical protein
MSSQAAESIVRELAGYPGMDGCALVDADTGMVWFHGGDAGAMEQIGEAAIEFWRIQMRLSAHFQAMGPLQSAAYAFSQRVVALFPCAERPPLVLVCVARRSDVAWAEWGKQVAVLKRALDAGQRVVPSTA